MNIIVGLILAGFFIVLGIPGVTQNWQVYIDLPSIYLVLGGTIATSIISASFKDMLEVVQIFTGIWFIKHKPVSNSDAVKKLVDISTEAYQNGTASVLDMGSGFGDGFLDRALVLLGTGLDEDFIRKTLEVDIAESQSRLYYIIGVISNMGGFAPMFGMLGTTAGVVLVLQNVTDIASVIDGLAFALITTIYGLMISNIVITPLTNQLKMLTAKEKQSKRIITEGILGVLRGDMPLKVEKFLKSFLSDAERKKFELGTQ